MSRRRLWDIGLLAALLLVAVAVVRQWHGAETGPEADAAKSPGSDPSAPHGERRVVVDLLDLIDAGKDRVSGEWAREGKSLLTPEVPFGRLLIPYVPPEEYILTVEVTRLSGTDSFNVGLVGGGRQFMAILDGMEGGDTTGIDVIGGKGFMDNPTTFRGKLLPPGQKRTLVYTVLRKSLTVSVDGRGVIAWSSDYGLASLYSEWAVSRTDALLVGSYASRYRIDRMSLTLIRGEGRALRKARPGPGR